MGFYIDPPNMSKEEWLRFNATPLDDPFGDIPEGTHRVCLVYNGGFTAAGICYNDGERDAFAHPDDRRKEWFVVEDERLIRVCPSVEGRLK